MYYRIAELHEEKLLDAPARSTCTSARSRSIRSTRRRGEEVRAPRRRSIDGGWETAGERLRRRPRAARRPGSPARRSASAWRACSKTSSATSPRPKRRTGTCSASRRSTPTRWRTSIASTPRSSRGPSSPASSSSASKRTRRPSRARRAYARLGEIYEDAARPTPTNAISRLPRASSTSSTRPTRRRSPRSAGSTSGTEAWTELNVVYERELENASGDVAEAEIRAKIAHLAATRLNDPGARDRHAGSSFSICAARIPRRSARSRTSTSSGQTWRELGDVLERHFDIAQTDDDRVNILTRRARALHRAAPARRPGARGLDTASSTSTTQTSRRSARSRRSGARAGRPERARSRAPPDRGPRGARCSTQNQLKEIFRELGKTYGEQLAQPYDAADAWRKLLEVGPRLRGDGRARGDSTAPKSSGPTSSTSRCSAPQR